MTAQGRAGTGLDGRALRSARTRERLVEAVMAEVGEGRAPTPEVVAARAGVSARTLFRLFGDLPGLWEAVRTKMALDVRRIIADGSFSGDAAARTRALVRRRIAVFEAIAPYRSWVDARESLYPEIRQGREVLDGILRAQTIAALVPELTARGDGLAPAIDCLLTFESWRYLRESRGLGRRKVASLLEAAVLRLARRRS